MASYEMNAFKEPFQKQVLANAKALAQALHAHGIPVEGDPADGYTETHQVIIRVKAFGPGMEIARRLETNNVLTNYQALPDDATFLESSGIRLGVQEMTRFGMQEKDFDTLAGLMADIIVRNKPAGDDVARYRKSFLTMGFSLPTAEALPLAARILSTVLPDPALCGRIRGEPSPGRWGSQMKILIVGSGGREHALAWKIAQSPRAEKVYCAPGNGGTRLVAENVPIDDTDIAGLADFAEREKIGLTVVGPEVPLTMGLADEFEKRGLKDLRAVEEGRRDRGQQGLRQAVHGAPPASRRPGSRSPTASTRPRRSWPRASSAFPSSSKPTAWPPARAPSSARRRRRPRRAAGEMLVKKKFGPAGRRVVIEEFLRGREVSFIVISDGDEGPAAGLGHGPQGRLRRRQGAQHRGHGRHLARRRS